MRRAALFGLAACGRIGYAPTNGGDGGASCRSAATPFITQLGAVDVPVQASSVMTIAPTQTGNLVIVATSNIDTTVPLTMTCPQKSGLEGGLPVS
jgi:hypothetical protein